MHKLKYLEITNFKSYKGNYRIPFPSHFTCIIGPNGSGKSNILDAIVFCTTNKPYNVRNTTVKLVLTNGTEEMIFTRYINVNGKNSYFFNNKKVLYKEYIDNFIIYQAHTDLNISKIIDEISGSCIYRDEYDRLNREYTEILGKLKIESEARKQYLTVLKENKKYEEEVKKNLEMMDRKKELEMKLFDLKIYSLFVKYNKLNKIDYKKILEIRELKKQNETIKNQKSVIQGYVSDIQDKIDQKQDILDKLNTDINSLDEIKNPIEGFDDLEKEYYRVLNNGDINNEDDSLNSDPVLINLIKSKDDLELRNKSKIDEYTKVLNEEVECTNVLNNINNEILLNKNIKVKSVKMYNLKSKLKKINGVIGFIPDLVSCTNDKYTISVRSLLSKYESTLVVEDEECAVECIKYCKVNRLGRITCISLKNNFDNRNKSNRNNNDKNNLIDPILVIDYPSDVKSIIEYLFFNIFITDHSFQDLHTYPDNYDICTIDGILIKNKGRLIKYNSTIHEQVDDLVVRRIEILDKLDNIRTIKDKYNNIELIQERIKKIERDIENRKMILTKKELSPNIVESKVFKDIFIKNGYINYNDYITRNSKYYKEEKDLRKNVLLDKKNKLEKEIYKLNLEIDRLKEEDGKLVLKEVEDIEEYPILDVEGEKERILEEVKDLYFIEKNVVIEDLNNIFNENYMKKIYKSIGDTKINTEDTKINTEDIKDYKIIIEYLNHELRNINNLLSSSSLLIKNTLKTDFNSDLYDTLKNKTFEIKGLLNTVRNKRNTLYLECIKSINESINILYSKILDGSCNLVVENKEDPFSGSVKYYVMVPNKKYKEYSYLSGGEQMISRIIFMYGVYQYRLNNSDKDKIIPSFILLDEVDSNLDNYNVNKLVQFIKNEDIQVVMVSLKVGVYKESDSMIGVYKREGKSNLLYYTY